MNIKNLLFILVVSCLSIVSCAQNNSKKEVTKDTSKTAESNDVIELIDPNDLHAQLVNDIQLIDVRTPKEYTDGYIKGAKNINFFDSDFLAKMDELDKSKPVYLYCRSGRRTGLAAKKLKGEGFTKVYDLQGGILHWNKKSLEIVK